VRQARTPAISISEAGPLTPHFVLKALWLRHQGYGRVT
jgi:hypothetical protein